MIIVGAGMAGLLAGNMLRSHEPQIVEKQESLPNNHEALLRFRSSIVSEVTRLPFKKVAVSKAVMRCGELHKSATLAESNRYSLKVLGSARRRSILSLDDSIRYIAPLDVISKLSSGLGKPITYDFDADRDRIDEWVRTKQPIISTLPMPILMKIMGWEHDIDFNYKTIYSVTVDISDPDIDLYQTIYSPDDTASPYRASITGNKLILEFTSTADMGDVDMWIHLALDWFGINDGGDAYHSKPIIKRHEYGKLLPIDDMKRKHFMVTMSDKYGIYSLGRFATWRQILLDDVVNDVNVIEKFINSRDANYSRNKHYSG